MTDPTNEMLAATLRILRNAKDNRCAVAAIKWRIGIAERDDAEQLMLAIREELTSHRLIGWSFPPNGSAELFLSDYGREWLAGLASDNARSISDDDLCSSCQHCVYHPGKRSNCIKNWPGKLNSDDYVVECASYERFQGNVVV